MGSLLTHLGWHAAWIVVGLLALLVPLACWRGHRWGYCVFLFAVLFLGTGGMWIRNHDAIEDLTLSSFTETADTTGDIGIGFTSHGDGIGVWYKRFIDQRDDRETLRFPSPQSFWARRPLPPGAPRFPDVREPLLKQWGFRLSLFGEPMQPNGLQVKHFWAIVVPNWFAMLVLTIPIGLYVRQLRHRRRMARWIRAGCCGHCGYDLRAHGPGDKCPECGTPVPAQPAKTPAPAVATPPPPTAPAP